MSSTSSRPHAAPFPDPLFVIHGHLLFQALAVAAKLDVFTRLSERPMTLAEVTSALGVRPLAARVLLVGCAVSGFVVRDAEGVYRNSEWSNQFLVRGKTPSLLKTIEAHRAVVYRPLDAALDAFVSGTNEGLATMAGEGATLYERMAHNPKHETAFHEWMEEVTRLLGPVDGEIGELEDRARLLELGGGGAENAIALAKRFPRLQITIFDLPSVCARAQRHIDDAKLGDRIAVAPGNFVDDPLPTGFDAVLAKHVTNLYAEEKNEALLRKVHDVLPSGGRLVIIDDVTDDGEAGPIPAAALSVYFQVLATGESMIYTAADYRRWIERAGFASCTERFPPGRAIFSAQKR